VLTSSFIVIRSQLRLFLIERSTPTRMAGWNRQEIVVSGRHSILSRQAIMVARVEAGNPGRAYNRPAYLRLWQRLNPDPIVPEVIRNYPSAGRCCGCSKYCAVRQVQVSYS
jgi:hypothetical protein